VSPAPSPTFTIGALAIAARRANAIGAVRLTVAAERLEIELLRVAGFAEGFAPGAIASTVCLTVPYLAVRGLLHRGRMLYLTLDPALSSPYNRFALVRFSTDPAHVLARAYRERVEARWVSYLVPGPLGALSALLTPASMVSGWLGRASLGLLVALALWVLLREIVAFRTWGGPISDHYRDAFEAELSRKLGLLPPAAAAPLPLDPAPAEAPEPALAPMRIGRSATAVAAAVIGVVATMAFLQRVLAPEEPPMAVPRLATGIAAMALRVRVDPSAFDAARRVEGSRCACMRADSPLWKGGVPALSILTFHGENEAATAIAPTAWRGGRMRYNFDLAVVNNGGRPERDVRVTLTFARRHKDGRRVGAVDRGLFWEGALAPGRAVKWHVSAPGTEMRIDTSVPHGLEQSGLEPASPDAFFELTRARFRAVRIHAAIMLAYLRDPRTDKALSALGDMSSEEERLTFARILRASAPIVACEVTGVGRTLEACIFNGSSQPQGGLELREVAPAADPAGAPAPALRRFRIEGVVPVHEGVRLHFPIEGELPEEWAVMNASDP
jgi:hypothetical protein